jgi:hypothetical protein
MSEIGESGGFKQTPFRFDAQRRIGVLISQVVVIVVHMLKCLNRALFMLRPSASNLQIFYKTGALA